MRGSVSLRHAQIDGHNPQSRTSVVFIKPDSHENRQCVCIRKPPKPQTGGNALEFYSSVRIDIRRIQTLQRTSGERPLVPKPRSRLSRTRSLRHSGSLCFVISFMAKAFRVRPNFLILALKPALSSKADRGFAFGSEKLGQGRDRIRKMLDENEDLRNAVETKVKEYLGIHPKEFSPTSEKWMRLLIHWRIWPNSVR